MKQGWGTGMGGEGISFFVYISPGIASWIICQASWIICKVCVIVVGHDLEGRGFSSPLSLCTDHK